MATMEYINDTEDVNENISIFKETLDFSSINYSNFIYDKVVKNIVKGNINKNGHLEKTPPGMNITLKLHQQRILYEMIQKENIRHRVSGGVNAFILADKVGSGKSLDVLALITKKTIIENNMSNKIIYKTHPETSFSGLNIKNTVEFKTNLIFFPHGIYNQWIEYITKYTKLTFYGVSNKKDLESIPYNDMVNGKCSIILLKSTRFNDFMNKVYTKYPYSLNKDNVENENKTILCNLYHDILKIKPHYRNNRELLDNFIKMKERILSVDIEKMKQNIENTGEYFVNKITEYTGPIFQRVFIDEANSIKIPRCLPVYGKINWFITSSVEDLLYPYGSYSNYNCINGIKGTGFIKNIFGQNTGRHMCNFIQDMYIKNKDSFVKQSFSLPEPRFLKIHCYTPPELNILHGIAIPEVIQALNAGDITTAIQHVGCTITNQTNIVDIVLYDLTIQLDNKTTILNDKQAKLNILLDKIKLDKNKLKELNNQITTETNQENMEKISSELETRKELLKEQRSNKQNINKSIKLHQEHITIIKSKMDSIKSRVTNIGDKECPICGQNVENPCMTPCCKNIFCLPCMAQALQYSTKKQCPLCRHENLSLSTLTAIMDNVPDLEVNILPTKLQTLIHLIKDNPSGKFLVFSEYNNSFNEMTSELDKEGITYNKLSGSTGRITNIIQKYDNSEIQVLLLNAKHFGSGLNLQMTSDIIIFHRMSDDLEKQVIGRGQRLGRTSTLNVTYLCYDNEMKTSE